jgi:AraC family transcriptional regulator
MNAADVLVGLSDSSEVAARHLSEAGRYARAGNADAAHMQIACAVELLRIRAEQSCTKLNSPKLRSRRSDVTALSAWRGNRVAAHIESNIDKPIYVADLARLVGISSAHFSRLFRRRFGLSAHFYITTRRIRFAQELMLMTTGSLCQIALQCGMTDQAHFTRTFRRIVGETPGRWRELQNDFSPSNSGRQSNSTLPLSTKRRDFTREPVGGI